MGNNLQAFVESVCGDKTVIDPSYLTIEFAWSCDEEDISGSEIAHIYHKSCEIIKSLGFKYNKRTDFYHKH